MGVVYSDFKCESDHKCAKTITGPYGEEEVFCDECADNKKVSALKPIYHCEYCPYDRCEDCE